MDERRLKLEYEHAMSLVAEGETVHTFRSSGVALLGAGWDRCEIEKVIKLYGCELSGERARKLNHGIVLEDSHGSLFIGTKDGVDWAAEESEAEFRLKEKR